MLAHPSILVLVFIGYISAFQVRTNRLPSFSLRNYRLQMNIIDAEPVNDNNYEPRRGKGSTETNDIEEVARRLGLDNVERMPPGKFEDPNEERVYKMIVENYQNNPNYNPLEDKKLIQELRAPPLGKPDRVTLLLVRLLNKIAELDAPEGRMNRQQWEEFMNAFPTREDLDKGYLEQFKDSKGFFAQAEEMLQELEADEREARTRSGGDPEMSPREFFATMKKLAPGYLESAQKLGMPFKDLDLNMIPDNWEDFE